MPLDAVSSVVIGCDILLLRGGDGCDGVIASVGFDDAVEVVGVFDGVDVVDPGLGVSTTGASVSVLRVLVA